MYHGCVSVKEFDTKEDLKMQKEIRERAQRSLDIMWGPIRRHRAAEREFYESLGEVLQNPIVTEHVLEKPRFSPENVIGRADATDSLTLAANYLNEATEFYKSELRIYRQHRL
jgi:hypothetical protein